MAKRTLLVAAGPKGRESARRALGKNYDLEFATSIAEACELVMRNRKRFAGVICGVFFDESRMFELLEFMRKQDHLDELPFVAVHFQQGATALTRASRRAAELLGGHVVELPLLPVEDGDARLLACIRAAVPIKKARADGARK